MATITAQTATGEVSFEAKSGRKLVLELEDNGVDILHRCGGNARCTTCAVELISGSPNAKTDDEIAILTSKGITDDSTRLSCQIRCNGGDLSVKVLNQASVKGIEPGTRPEE